MKRFARLLLLTLPLVAQCQQQTQVNPVSQINWPAASGSGPPAQYCPVAVTGNIATGSNVVTALSGFAGVLPNQTAVGSGVPSGAYVQQSNNSAGTLRLSLPATATATGVALALYSYGMPYTDTLNGNYYACGSGGWFKVNGGSGGGSIGDSDVTNQTASQGTVNLVGSVPATGKYRVSYYATQHTLCASGSASVLFTFGFVDPNSTRSVRSVSLTLGASQSPLLGIIEGVIPVYSVALTAITYTSTVTGSCATGGPASYDAHISVEAVQ